MARMKSRITDELPFCFTSMIDVVFLLLIFFILQPLRSPEKRFPQQMSDGAPSQRSIPRPLVRLGVQPDPRDPKFAVYHVDNRLVGSDLQQLRAAVRRAARDNGITVAVSPDPRVHFRWVLAALDQCAITGLDKVKFEAPAAVR